MRDCHDFFFNWLPRIETSLLVNFFLRFFDVSIIFPMWFTKILIDFKRNPTKVSDVSVLQRLSQHFQTSFILQNPSESVVMFRYSDDPPAPRRPLGRCANNSVVQLFSSDFLRRRACWEKWQEDNTEETSRLKCVVNDFTGGGGQK